jgi:nucleoside-diphosphate-sugar epimerase
MAGGKSMRIFLTGATGFVGANIARRLLKEGHEVHVSIRKGSGTWRLASIMSQLNVHTLDITNYGAVCHTMQSVSPESIIHMATYGAYTRTQTNFNNIFETNMIGTINLVRACDDIRYETFINTGSSSEYGLVKKKMSENDVPMPVNYYGATKAGATIFCQTHARITNKPIITTRLFSVYGPYEEPIRLVPSTIRNCLLHKRLEMTTGLQKRDFIYTQDIEDAYLELIRRPDLKGEVLNLGTGMQYTVMEMVEAIVEETKTKSKPVWGAKTSEEKPEFDWVSDTSKADLLLYWRPKHSLEMGVKKTVNWMRKNLVYYEGD